MAAPSGFRELYKRTTNVLQTFVTYIRLTIVLHYCGLMAWGIWLIYVSVPKGPIYQSIKDTKCHVRGLWWIMKSMQNENFSCDMHQMQACDRQKFPQGCVHSILNNFHTVKPCFHKMNLIFNIRSTTLLPAAADRPAAAASEWTTLHDSNQISTDCYNFLHSTYVCSTFRDIFFWNIID